MKNLNPYVKKSIRQIKEPLYSKKEIFENPTIYTLNTLRGRIRCSPCSYWLKIPKEIINNMGLKISNLSNLKVILIKNRK